MALDWEDPVVGPDKCVRVSAGTSVVWSGDFGAHPLSGGVAPYVDRCSVVTRAAPIGQSITVTFGVAGTYPFFCSPHPDTMLGAIYVE